MIDSDNSVMEAILVGRGIRRLLRLKPVFVRRNSTRMGWLSIN